MKTFLLSFLFNLFFSAELLLLAVIAWLVHIFLDSPMFVVYILLGLWVLIALLVTLGLGALSRGTSSTPYQKNVNPYSKTTKDFLKKSENNSEYSED